MNNFIKVNSEKCTKCGLCVKICRGTLVMSDLGPKVDRDLCIECGHCVAVCPNGALDSTKTPLDNQVQIQKEKLMDSDIAATFLRSRRSIRAFQKRDVSRDIISELLNIARFAPTACNSQGLSYHVIDNHKILHEITSIIADWTEESIENGVLKNSPWVQNTVSTIAQYRNDNKDTILRDAPCLVIATVPREQKELGRDNTHFSLTYVQLYAQTLGLGTCWSGLFEYCSMAEYEPLLRLLNISKDRVVTGALLVGYPLYKFKRLVDRNPLEITWQ
ncbi:nitroreductase family protein [Clostridium diolis]|uniref:Ferredoxin n=1 Tax=Clostridium diolis TaxID=223919 RepID=A0AAV3W7P7_9CLOT|nr:nitroreductase family protein [Clostridium diolis]QES74562.1 ferredoxin [Clostridium diolis]GEA34199.1 ferredoxin [Clostridium diolis]